MGLRRCRAQPSPRALVCAVRRRDGDDRSDQGRPGWRLTPVGTESALRQAAARIPSLRTPHVRLGREQHSLAVHRPTAAVKSDSLTS
jgi:hypothetical protein